MTVVAQITAEGEQADLDQVLTGFSEDDLTLKRETDSSSTDTRTVEVRTSKGEVLSQFHHTCVEHDITLDIRRLYREPDQTRESATVKTDDSETDETERVD